VGDTVELARHYDAVMPLGDPRMVLVDTFKDEAEETLRVADALGEKLAGIRLDTPGERGACPPTWCGRSASGLILQDMIT
jgi:nicotinate phosphoribosyltransferase